MMACTKDYADDVELDEDRGSSSTSITECEKARLIDSHDLLGAQSTAGRSARSGRTIFFLSLSNAISISILLFVVVAMRPGATHCKDPTSVFYPPRPKWFPPEIPVTKILEADDLYARAPDEESLKAWDRLMPLGRGLVKVNNESALPEMPRLDQSLPRGATAWIAISHQLHCLYSTKNAFYDLYNNRSHKREEPLGVVEWKLEHLNHCWDYLRQALMCSADVTLEWRGKVEGTGWGYQHQCKDWDAIYHWIENHRLTNDRGILRNGGERHPLDTSIVPGVWGTQ